MCVGLAGAVGARYPPKGAELFFAANENLFQGKFAYIAPLGRREGADLVRVQGPLVMPRDQRKFHHWLIDKESSMMTTMKALSNDMRQSWLQIAALDLPYWSITPAGEAEGASIMTFR